MRDEVALVAGASGEIGRAVALALAEAGAHVAVHCHRGGRAAEALAGEIRALGQRAIVVEADLGARALPAGFLKPIARDLGPISHLVYSAGLAHEDLAAFLSLDDWDEVQNVNLRGAVLMSQAVLPAMLRARAGAIVFVGSEAGVYGSPGLGAYAASKAGLVALARSLASEVGSRGVRVNVVSPGPVETALLLELPPEKREALLGRTALGRFGTPADVASAVRFLLSDEARFVTGAVLPVNGGLGMF